MGIRIHQTGPEGVVLPPKFIDMISFYVAVIIRNEPVGITTIVDDY
jgi:hypothetical protein